MADDAAQIHAVMRPRRRQVLADDRIDKEADANRRHDPAGGAPRRFQHQQNQRAAEYLVPHIGIDRALEESVAAEQHVADDHQRNKSGHPVPPHDAVAELLGDRKQQEAEEQNKRDMDAAQDMRRHDAVCGVEVKDRHDHRQRGGHYAEGARQLVDCALFLLDVLLGLFNRLGRNDGFVNDSVFDFRHDVSPVHEG